MNHVTFETAKALREAGFPQAAPQQGQHWYFDAPTGATYAVYVLRCVEGLVVDCVSLASGRIWTGPLTQRFVFAPTATDILPHIKNVFFFWAGRGWICEQDLPFDGCSFEHEDPAEAAAQLWLKINKK